MPTYFLNPENALKRANEFCELGKQEEALECLYDTLKSRKNKIMRHIHENIIQKFLELCVELKKSQMAKDGLYSYRSLCQGINMKSWEDSVRKYLQLAESKVENAQDSFQSVTLDVDDLDQGVTPELLLKFVSNEGTQERTERIILLPWVKFLWECHRNCLDLLRGTQTEKLYQMVAQNAFKFCVKFSRRSELRKLCNIIKMHSLYMQKRQSYLKLNNTEAQLISLETGFVELESAVTMELWQDAFKAIEDIHTIINVLKKYQHSRIMAHYYDKISRVFWKGEEYLFHAAANLRYFLLIKDQKKNLSSEDIIKSASRVMISILSVPPPPVNLAVAFVAETDATVIDKKNRLLSSLLDLSKCPTRDSLIKEAVRNGIVQYLPEALKVLFLSVEKEPLKLGLSLPCAIDFIKNWIDCDLEKYMSLLNKVAVLKLLPVLSRMYVNIKMSKLLSFTGISSTFDLEIILVDSARRYEFPLRIDHKNMSIHFSSAFNIFQNESVWNEWSSKSSSPDTFLRGLTYTHSALKNAVEQIHPERRKNENKLIAEKIFRRYNSEKEAYRKNLLQRKSVIEKYKEEIENLRITKEEEERKHVTEKLLQYELAEKERLLKEAEERKQQRLRREQEEIKRKMLLEKMETFKKSILGSQIIGSLGFEDFDNLDPQILFSKQIEQLNKERKELSTKLRRQERTFDHLERAKRQEEIPLLLKQYEKEKKANLEIWKIDERIKIEVAHANRERNLYNKKRMIEIKEDLNKFIKTVKISKSKSYEEEKGKFMEKLQEQKQKRLQNRAKERKQSRIDQWIKQNYERQQETEFNNREICHTKNEGVPEPIREIGKNKTKKTVGPPLNPVSSIIDNEAVFAEDLKSCDKSNSFYSNIKNRKSTSTETAEQFKLSRDIYYSKSVCKGRSLETERNEVYKQATAFYPEYLREPQARTKREIQKTEYYSTSNRRVFRRVDEATDFEKREEDILSWRTQSHAGTSNKNRYGSIKKEDEVPRKTIIIMRRNPKPEMAEIDKGKTDSAVQHRKTEERRNDAEHSCTPWAKLKRKEPNK